MGQGGTYRRDHYAGGLVALVGAGAAVQASRYNIGTLFRMGPGFFPVCLGILLVLIGILIASTAGSPEIETADGDNVFASKAEWRRHVCIIAAPILFIVLGDYGGLIPAAFACVFVAALGDPSTTARQALTLAIAVTFFGVLLFSRVLQISLPLWHWGST